MEEFKKVLKKNKIVLTFSSDDNSDCESITAQQLKNCNKHRASTDEDIYVIKSSKRTKRNGEKRLPTRKPDPNVYNRNALLARENRKKKKIYLETIEKELDVVKKANLSLAKALRTQLKIAEQLEKEKQYYENIVKNRFKVLDLASGSNSHHIQRTEENCFPAVSCEDDLFKDIMNISRSRSRSSSEADDLSMLFDSASDGSVVAPEESSACVLSSFDFSFPEFSTDLYDSPDVTLPSTSTTWDDIWGNKDSFISSNISIFQNSANMQSLNVDHCYARGPIKNKDSSDQESDPCSFDDDEGMCSCNGTDYTNNHIFPTYHTPPTQLLKQSS